MIITCPDCATAYELPSDAIGADGRLVQCDDCEAVWTQMPVGDEPKNVAAEAEVPKLENQPENAAAGKHEDEAASDAAPADVPVLSVPQGPAPEAAGVLLALAAEENKTPDGPEIAKQEASAAPASETAPAPASETAPAPASETAPAPASETAAVTAGEKAAVDEAPVSKPAEKPKRAKRSVAARTKKEAPAAAELPAPPLEAINVKSEAARLARASANANLAYERNRQRKMQVLRGWGVLAASVVVLATPAVAFPRHVTTLFPAAAQLYEKVGVSVNKRGLEFREISYRRELDEGVLVLVIEGKVVNVSGSKHELAPLRIALLDDLKQDLYTWTLKTEPDVLEPSGAATFKTRLAAPPSDATDLQIRFALPNEAE